MATFGPGLKFNLKCCMHFFIKVMIINQLNKHTKSFDNHRSSFSSAHISLAVSDVVTRAFTLQNACVSRIGPFVAGADQIC